MSGKRKSDNPENGNFDPLKPGKMAGVKNPEVLTKSEIGLFGEYGVSNSIDIFKIM